MSQKKWNLNRRTVIKGMGASIALPLLECMLPSIAYAAADPKRYCALVLPHGTYMIPNGGANWFAKAGALSANALPVVFQPFASNMADIALVKGIASANAGSHYASLASYLTCRSPSGASSQCQMPADSVDQVFGKSLNFKPMSIAIPGALGAMDGAAGSVFPYAQHLSYVDGGAADTYRNPVSLWNLMFAGLPAGTGPTPTPPPGGNTAQPAAMRNKSILDATRDGIARLKGILGKEDNVRLDKHLTEVGELEKILQGMSGGGGGNGGGIMVGSSCQQPAKPAAFKNQEDGGGDSDFGRRIEAFIDLIAMAFKCDLTRASTFLYETEAGGRGSLGDQVPANLIYGNANMAKTDHDEMAHWGDGGQADENERMNRCISRDRFYMSMMVRLINNLKQAQDPSGATVFDNTVIQSGHVLGEGNHNVGVNDGIGAPTVLAGGKGLLRLGYQYDFNGGATRNDLYYSISKFMGANIANFQGSTKILKLTA
jgi:hypothetical protein